MNQKEPSEILKDMLIPPMIVSETLPKVGTQECQKCGYTMPAKDTNCSACGYRQPRHCLCMCHYDRKVVSKCSHCLSETTEWENEFALLWGIAPDESLKGKRGAEIKSFISTQKQLSFEQGKQEAVIEIISILETKGHGGGNYRRLISQIQAKYLKENT